MTSAESALLLNGTLWVFLIGVVGGAFVELSKWYKLREANTFGDYAKSPVYWGLTILMILAGGAWAVINGITNVSAIQVIALGASAPLSFAGLGSAAASVTTSKTGTESATDGAKTISMHTTGGSVKHEKGSVVKFLAWQ